MARSSASDCRLGSTEPPSTTMVWPVMYDAASLARKAITSATSFASPTRPSGVPDSAAVRHSSLATTISVSGVRIMPGATAFTRTAGASSTAAVWVRLRTPALAAEYGPSPRVGRRPVSDALFTMDPRPASSMIGAADRIRWKVPVRLTPMSSAHSLSV
jgi:hypothetical protein